MKPHSSPDLLYSSEVTEIEADKPIGVSCNESVGHCISEPYICSLCDVVGH